MRPPTAGRSSPDRCSPTSPRPCCAGCSASAVRAGRRRAPRSRSTCCSADCPACATRTCARSRRSPARSTSTRATPSWRRPIARRRPGGSPTSPRARCTATRWPTRRSSSAELQAAGAQTLTVFALHMPARLFRDDPRRRARREAKARGAGVARQRARRADRGVPARPRLHRGDGSAGDRGRPRHARRAHLPSATCSGRSPSTPSEVGRWGVETEHANVFVCGAGARRGGGVSAIPGRNAAMAALGDLTSESRGGGAPRRRRRGGCPRRRGRPARRPGGRRTWSCRRRRSA